MPAADCHRLIRKKFFCCGGTRTLPYDTNNKFLLSMYQNDLNRRDVEAEELGGDDYIQVTDSERLSVASTVSYDTSQNFRQSYGLRSRARDIFSTINKKKDNRITFAEFYAYLSSEGSSIDRIIAHKVFRQYDSSETGYLTFCQFCKIWPTDGNFVRIVQADAIRIMKALVPNLESSRQKQKRSKPSVTTIKDPVPLEKEYVPKQSFLSPSRSVSDLPGFYIPNDGSKKVLEPAYVSRGEHKSIDYEEDMDSSIEDNPELMVLYARRTLRSSTYSNEWPHEDKLPRQPRALSREKTTVVKFLEDDEEDFTSPELQAVGNLKNTSRLKDVSRDPLVLGKPHNMSSLLGLRHSVYPKYDERIAQRCEPLAVLDVGSRIKSIGTLNESDCGSLLLARSPDTSSGSQRIAKTGDKFLVHIDYGPLEVSSKLAVGRDKNISYLKQLISRMKNTPSHSIRIRHRGRVLTNSALSLEQLGLDHHHKLMVDLAGGVPFDEANRVVSINKRLLHESNNQLKDYAAYLCSTPASREAIERISIGMAQKGWAVFDPESEELVSTNVQQLVEAMKRCHLFLLFITRDIASDSWVLLQILVAHKLDKEFHVVFETDPRLGGFAAASSFTSDINYLLQDVSKKKVIPWSDKRNQQCEIFDYLAKQLTLHNNHFQPKHFVTSPTLQYTSGHKMSSTIISPISTISSFSVPSEEKDVGALIVNDTSELKEDSLANNSTMSSNEQPSFRPTKNRMATYKLVDRSSKFAFNITDMDYYLKENEVCLTSDELANLFSTISLRNKSTISMAEFIKYCPPNGAFAEKVWNTIVKCRAS
jgi:Ca2+-binding EF-hand superfamily protein